MVRVERRQHRHADRQGTGFIEHHRGDRVRHLQRLGVLDQDAVACRHAGAGHDRRRRGKAQGARAGNHQYGHGVDNRRFQVAAGNPPAQQRHQRQHQHHRHEDGTDLVHQMLDRRLGRLRVFHQPDNARQGGLQPHGTGTHQQHAGAVHGAARHLLARVLAHGQALAGDQRFIDIARAFEHDAINRYAGAGAHHDQIAQQHLGHRNIVLLAVAAYPGRLGAQHLQRPDGRSGLALGARFEPLAQQDQGDDDGRGLEIQVRHAAVAGQQQVHAQAISGAGAEGDQQVHIAGASPHRFPAGPVKAPAEQELHRRCQRPLQHARQRPVQAGPLEQHRQHQG